MISVAMHGGPPHNIVSLHGSNILEQTNLYALFPIGSTGRGRSPSPHRFKWPMARPFAKAVCPSTTNGS